MTRSEIDTLLTKGHYNWMGFLYSPSKLDPQSFSVKALGEALGEKLIATQYLSEVLGLKIERDDYDQQKGKISLETDRIASAISRNIKTSSGISVNDTLSVTNIPDRLKTAEGYIDALWLEHHGFGGIKVKIKLDNISQKYILFDLSGNPIKDFTYSISVGNIGGAQVKDTIKLYTVAFAKDSTSYAILVCPDIEAAPVIDGMREICINVFATNLRKEAAIALLGNPPFNLTDAGINRLFAPTPETQIAKGGGQ